ncbi:MAG: tRNA-specific adenosine deaminase, partial [Actinobacteria bacterium]|nr:tRNA-specific adenosine deaminase [Actinomycetota bacterium]
GSLYNFAADPRLNHAPLIRHSVLAHEAGELLAEFFRSRRDVS